MNRLFPRARVISVSPMKKGCVNETYDIRIENPKKDLVLRVYPKEDWKAVKEAYIYKLLSEETDVPVPKVLFLDTSRKLLPKKYIVLSKVRGSELDKKDPKLVAKAAEYLAKIHRIRFSKFGWIINKKIRPSFDSWQAFSEYDLKHKISGLRRYKRLSAQKAKRIWEYFRANMDLLAAARPCLLHKDYHSSHILTEKGRITGIIDVEWAISGHNELDLTKSLMWMFERDKAAEKIFLRAYARFNPISDDFPSRRKLYRLLISVSSALFSCQLNSTRWLRYHMDNISRIIR